MATADKRSALRGVSERGREVEFILSTGDLTVVSTPIGTA